MFVFTFILGSLSACKGPASSADEDRWSLPTATATEFSDIVEYSQLTVWSYSDEI